MHDKHERNSRKKCTVGETQPEHSTICLRHISGNTPKPCVRRTFKCYTSSLREEDTIHLVNKFHRSSLMHVRNACAGSIPAWLGSLKKLRQLQLYNNQLGGERATSQRDRRIQLVRQRPWRDMRYHCRMTTFYVFHF